MFSNKLNPKIDLVFRKLFGSEENKELLISLINSVVSPDPPIVDVTIKNPFNLADYRGSKESILDIKAVDQNGVWYDVEMQIEAHVFYGRRAIYYLSKTYTDQLEVGDNYSKLNTTIGIHFLDFRYFEDDRVLRQFVLKDTVTNEAPDALDGIQLYFIELAKFDKDWPAVRTALDRWMAFLNRAAELDQAALPVQLAAEPALVRAVTQLDRMGLNPEERDVYEGEVKKRMVDEIQLKSAEERGIQLGMNHLLLKQLTHRVGEVPATIADRLRRLNAESLDALSVELLDFTSYSDVERWLTSH
jgi:predicted transposase/invertase (TIGR01784 family)